MKVYDVWLRVETCDSKEEAVDFIELNYEPDEFTKIIEREVK